MFLFLGDVVMKFTKITASIGPNCEDKNVLTEMVRAGVNVCRLNFSHDTGDVQGAKIDIIRSVSKKLGTPVAVMIDIQGPKHRIGDFKTEEHYPLKVGQKFILDSDETPGDENRVYLPDMDVMRSLSVGDRILLNDGKIVGSGSHDELLKENKYYKKLYESELNTNK